MAPLTLNVFPAIVELSDGQRFDEARVYVSPTGKVYVFKSSSAKPDVVLEHVQAIDGRASRTSPATITLQDGKAVVFRDKGCGCSHPLKRFNARQWA